MHPWKAPTLPRRDWVAAPLDIPRVSPLRPAAWRRLSVGFPNPALRDYALAGIEDGFDSHTSVAEDGPWDLRNAKSVHASASQAAHTREWIDGERAVGRYVPVPEGVHPYLRVVPLGAATKRSCKPGVLAWRTTSNLSAPGPGGSPSVNACIDGDQFGLAYERAEDVCASVLAYGSVAWLVKWDEKAAFRQLPLHRVCAHLHALRDPDTRELLLDVCLGFGAVSSPFNCCAAALVKKWILHRAPTAELTRLGLGHVDAAGRPPFVLHQLLDDMGAVCRDERTAAAVSRTAVRVFAELGVVLRLAKCSCGHEAEWLGLVVNARGGVVGLGQDKRGDYSRRCDEARGSITVKTAQSLVGKLTFAHCVLAWARPLCGNLLRVLAASGNLDFRNRRNQHRRVKIDVDTECDLILFSAILRHAPARLLADGPRPRPDHEAWAPLPSPLRSGPAARGGTTYAHGDASGVDGMGWFTSGRVAYRRWEVADFVELVPPGAPQAAGDVGAWLGALEQWDKGLSSTLLETVCMGNCVSSLLDSGAVPRGSTLVYFCDNYDVASNQHRGRAGGRTDRVLRALVVPLQLACVRLEVRWRGRTCPVMRIADKLSHCDHRADQALVAWKETFGREPVFAIPGCLPPLAPGVPYTRRCATSLRNLWRGVPGSSTAGS